MPTPAENMSAARRAVDAMLADTRRRGVPDLVVARVVDDALGRAGHARDAATIAALRAELDVTRDALDREQTAAHRAHNVAATLRAELDEHRPAFRLD